MKSKTYKNLFNKEKRSFSMSPRFDVNKNLHQVVLLFRATNSNSIKKF